ncbi:MAG: DUF1194 domain-containing protein [Methylobacteriaceae bacterium]|nr:DUF1194 domain-containing protein [Methylobacteriaceae bacterium]
MSAKARFAASVFAAAFAACVPLAGAAGKGGATAVDVELVLAVDISYSMDEEEQHLQREGYIEALQSDEFQKALRAGPNGRIAVAYMEWASSYDQRTIVNWTVIDSPQTARAFATQLSGAPYRRASRTSISGAIDGAMRLFENNGYDGARHVIDISGDGPNNNGRPVTQAREDALAQGITINGLPLLIRPVRAAYMDIENLDWYYEDCVIGGPGAFMIPVRGPEAFSEGTRTKLVLDIASAPQAVPQANPFLRRVSSEKPRISCYVGESLWRQRMGE